MSVRPWSGVRLAGLPGVWEMARDHGLVWNRRDPSAWPLSGKDPRYKPMVKAKGGQRESDGAVVPLIGVQHNAPGGKGPDFGHASEGGKHGGMAGTARSNHPGRPIQPVALHQLPPVGAVRCENSNARYGLRPSSLRVGVSTLCSTGFTGVTSCGWRGIGSEPIVAQLGSTR
jgi:hypothetical protein